MNKSVVLGVVMSVLSASVMAEMVNTHAIVGFGEAKYPKDFSHYDYVNPDAPKGGHVTYSDIGSYDNFNRYASRGVSAALSDAYYDTLFVASADEIDSSYPLIATGASYDSDYTEITFTLNPSARFHDGDPIDADDVVFSFEKFMTQGVPQFASFYEDVDSYTALDAHTVQFKLKQSNRDVLFALATLTILPKHYWAERDLSEPLLEPPLSSGPYKVSDFEMGSWVKYERVEDYWAANLPVNKGRHNFATLRYDYYKDTNVALEAFKAGEFDLRQENVSKNWAELYNGPNMDAGYIVKEEIPHDIPQGMQGFVFNTEREFFSDVRVREALTLAMDFEWMNKSLFYGQYSRSLSYFQNSEYQATGLPNDAQVAALEPYRDEIPARVFTEEYSLPITDGSGRNRRELRQAGKLLDEAGWGLVDGKRVNANGTELSFELLAYSPTTERIATPLIKNLEKLGVTMSIRMVDTAQYTKRMRDRDFDMISSSWQTMLYPNSNLLFYWNSNYIDSTYNKPGVRSAAVDALTQAIADNQENPEQLAVLGPALDRVLLWNFYAIPQWHISMFRVAYWDKFARPSVRPTYDIGVDTWWIDADKAAKLPEGRQ